MELLLNRFRTMKGTNKILVTTEKDAVRMTASPYFPPELRSVAYYLPVKVEFSQQGEAAQNFEQALVRRIRNWHP